MDDAEIRLVTLDVDTSIYRLAAIKKAAYKFGDRCSVEIESLPQGRVRLILRPNSPSVDSRNLESELRNELLDQELREHVAEETDGVRRLLLAQAFSSISLTDRLGDTADYNEDPRGIRA